MEKERGISVLIVYVSSARSSDLKKHIQKIHVGEEHCCNQCEYSFNKVELLTRHIKSKHEGVNFPCNECSFSTTIEYNLFRHKKSKHQDNPSVAKKKKLEDK